MFEKLSNSVNEERGIETIENNNRFVICQGIENYFIQNNFSSKMLMLSMFHLSVWTKRNKTFAAMKFIRSVWQVSVEDILLVDITLCVC